MTTTVIKWLICLWVVASVMGLSEPISQAQNAELFKSILSQFAIALPLKGSEYGDGIIPIAEYAFPVRQYTWKQENETLVITAGSGINDLELPEYTKLFLSDFQTQQATRRVKDNSKLIEAGPWTFEGHPGWRSVEETNGVRSELRVFVVRYWFFVFSISTRATQTDLDDRQKQVLASFRILSVAELDEAREQLVGWINPDSLPQSPVTDQTLSDAREDNLRDNVKRVTTEESTDIGPSKSGSNRPLTRTDYDQQGYFLTRVEYLGKQPIAVTRFGVQNGSRIFRKTSGRALPEMSGSPDKMINRTGTITVRKVQRKYRKDGSLEEIRIIDSDDRVVEVYNYQNKRQRLETSYSDRLYNLKNLELRWKSTVAVDPDGNPVSEWSTEFSQGNRAEYRAVDKSLNPHDVITDSLRGRSIVNSIGMPTTTVGNVITNPNRTERVVEALQDSKQKKAESEFAHVYDYDSHRNWIKRITFLVKRNGDSVSRVTLKTTYRTITYY